MSQNPRILEKENSVVKVIASIEFGVLSAVELRNISEVQVHNRSLYQHAERIPAKYGCLDGRLGPQDRFSNCETCGKRSQECPGHFGFVHLELPAFHTGFFRHTLTIVQCVCKDCGKVLLDSEDREKFLRRMQNPSCNSNIKTALFKQIVAKCKLNRRCYFCHAFNGPVRKVAPAVNSQNGTVHRISHDRLGKRSHDDVISENIVYEEKDDEAIDDSKASKKKTTKKRKNKTRKKRTEDMSDGRDEMYVIDQLLHAPNDDDDDGRQQQHQLSHKLKDYSTEFLTPSRVLEILRKIPNDDCELLWMDPTRSRPEDLVLSNMPVPPVAIRPSVLVDTGVGGSNEDDLTVKLQEIVELNNAMKLLLDQGGTIKTLFDNWDSIQMQVNQFINGETPGLKKAFGSFKPVRGICQRLKGKQGRFRGNLSGKRVDFSGRTVISPDPNLDIDEVGVPIFVAMKLSFPEKVNALNIHRLRKLVENGSDIYPGANIVRTSTNARSLEFGDKRGVAASLSIGDVVERHLENGDIVLFNRQPSLHRLSIMCHRVRVLPWRTFRFNECVCTPYNADFDGDEMNIHVPQTEEARAEAAVLMAVAKNIVTPRNGDLMVAAIQDFMTGCYLLTQKNVFLTKGQFCQLSSYFLLSSRKNLSWKPRSKPRKLLLPPPTIIKPVELWTGKQVLSLLVRSGSEKDLSISFDCAEKGYSDKGKHLCMNDGYVCFRNSELCCGVLGKKVLGNGSKTGLLYAIFRDYGHTEAIECMSRIAKLCARLIGGHLGLSIGFDDVTPSEKLREVKAKLLVTGNQEATEKIELFKANKLKLRPGCNARQSLEAELTAVLGRIRDVAAKEAMKALAWTNSVRIMADCGSKGSPLNVAQMTGCLGQQSVGGLRMQDGFIGGRSLPHFPFESLAPAAKGFVANSFYSGLTATEFFFHTMGGREGLVDTAVKTAETGYMARRMMKAIEDLSVQYDGTVRSSEGNVMQFSYGYAGDGMNPQYMETESSCPVDFDNLFKFICGSFPDKEGCVLSSKDLRFEAQLMSRSSDYSALPAALVLKRQSSSKSKSRHIMSDDTIVVKKESDLSRLPMVKPDRSASFCSNDFPLSTGQASGLDLVRNMLLEDFRIYLMKLADNVEKDVANSNGTRGPIGACRLTKDQMDLMLKTAWKRYQRAQVEPGESVGAIGAQSISEPGTQMTLKTFHFAGVATMNVTLGVPRLKEIINGTGKISTPIITAPLTVNSTNFSRLTEAEKMASARIAKGYLQTTKLSEACIRMNEVLSQDDCYVEMVLDVNFLRLPFLNLSPSGVTDAIRRYASKVTSHTSKAAILKQLKEDHFAIYEDKATGQTSLRVRPPEPKQKANRKKGSLVDGVDDSLEDKVVDAERYILNTLYTLSDALKGVVLQGIQSLSRVVINSEDVEDPVTRTKRKLYSLLGEGNGLLDVLGKPGIDGVNVTSNNILEIEKVLGIEAARSSVIIEIEYIMKMYAITIDKRHLSLLADVMTFYGKVLGITRFGVAKLKQSVLMNASFEKTTDHLFDAAVHSKVDHIVGVSECIIMGVPVPLGTGMFDIIQNMSMCPLPPRKDTIFQANESLRAMTIC